MKFSSNFHPQAGNDTSELKPSMNFVLISNKVTIDSNFLERINLIFIFYYSIVQHFRLFRVIHVYLSFIYIFIMSSHFCFDILANSLTFHIWNKLDILMNVSYQNFCYLWRVLYSLQPSCSGWVKIDVLCFFDIHIYVTAIIRRNEKRWKKMDVSSIYSFFSSFVLLFHHYFFLKNVWAQKSRYNVTCWWISK